MAHFAQIGLNNKVIAVVAVDDSVLLDSENNEREDLGIDYLANITGWAVWKQTWLDGSKRGRYAGKNYIYDEDNDIFLPAKPFPSWIIDVENSNWKAPVDYPTDGEYYVWDEPSGSWIDAEKPANNWE